MTNIDEDFVRVYETLSQNESRKDYNRDVVMFNAWKNFNELKAAYVAILVFMQPETKFAAIPIDESSLKIWEKSYEDSYSFFKKTLLESLCPPKGPLSRALTLLGKANIFIHFHNAAVEEWIRCRKSISTGKNILKKRSLRKKGNVLLLGMFWTLVKPNNPIQKDPLSRMEALQFLVRELGSLPIVGTAIGYPNEESLRKKIERLEISFKKETKFIENIDGENGN